MIHFNTPKGMKERQATKPLSLKEEEKVIELLNEIVERDLFTIGQEMLLQRFVNHYQNLNHFKATTCGLWATEKEMLNDGDFFQITF